MRLSSRSGASATCCSIAAATAGLVACRRIANSACASLMDNAYRDPWRLAANPRYTGLSTRPLPAAAEHEVRYADPAEEVVLVVDARGSIVLGGAGGNHQGQ